MSASNDPELDEKRRRAIEEIAGGNLEHLSVLMDFVSWLIFMKLEPTSEKRKGGDLYRWLAQHRYRGEKQKQLNEWLFKGMKDRTQLPFEVQKLAIIIVTNLVHGNCNCPKIWKDNSERAYKGANSRCPSQHRLSALKTTKGKYADPLLFVQRAVYGDCVLPSHAAGFSTSMLAAEFETPDEKKLVYKENEVPVKENIPGEPEFEIKKTLTEADSFSIDFSAIRVLHCQCCEKVLSFVDECDQCNLEILPWQLINQKLHNTVVESAGETSRPRLKTCGFAHEAKIAKQENRELDADCNETTQQFRWPENYKLENNRCTCCGIPLRPNSPEVLFPHTKTANNVKNSIERYQTIQLAPRMESES